MAKVLVVEENVETCASLVATIDGMGHSAFVVPNATHASAALEANRDIALLIVDAYLQGTDGEHFIRSVRDSAAHGDIPIIVVSCGYVGPIIIASLLEHGAAWFMSKPISTEQLAEYVRRSLKTDRPQMPELREHT